MAQTVIDGVPDKKLNLKPILLALALCALALCALVAFSRASTEDAETKFAREVLEKVEQAVISGDKKTALLYCDGRFLRTISGSNPGSSAAINWSKAKKWFQAHRGLRLSKSHEHHYMIEGTEGRWTPYMIAYQIEGKWKARIEAPVDSMDDVPID